MSTRYWSDECSGDQHELCFDAETRDCRCPCHYRHEVEDWDSPMAITVREKA